MFDAYHSLACAQVIDFYLDDERAPERAKIISLAQRDDRASFELLKGYVREGQSKLSPIFPSNCLNRFLFSPFNQDSILKLLQSPELPFRPTRSLWVVGNLLSRSSLAILSFLHSRMLR